MLLAARVLAGWRTILTQRGILLRTGLVYLLTVAVKVLLFYVLYRMLGRPAPFGAVAVMCGMGGVVAMLALTPAGLGFFDITAAVTANALGVPYATSTIALAAFRAIDFAIILVAGPIATWYLIGRRGAADPDGDVQ